MGFKGRIFKDASGGTLPYRLFQPAGYDPKKAYPLVLYLHHAGLAGNQAPSGQDNCRQLTEEAGSGGYGGVFRNGAQAKHPHFIVAPHAPMNTFGWGGGMDGSFARPPLGIQAQIFGILSEVRKEFSIDPKRIYVTGISMGCFGTWDIIMRNPTYFAAASPQSCGGDPAGLPNIVNVPIWDFCGSNDQLFATQSNLMAATFKALKPLDFTYTVMMLPVGAGHSVANRGYDWVGPPSLIDWLFAQTNKSASTPDGGAPGGDAASAGPRDAGSADVVAGLPDAASGTKADVAIAPVADAGVPISGPMVTGGGSSRDAAAAPVDEEPAVGGPAATRNSGGALSCTAAPGPLRSGGGVLALGLAFAVSCVVSCVRRRSRHRARGR